jgi:hypothetical protein
LCIGIPETYEEAISDPVYRGDWNEAIHYFKDV